MICVQVLHFNSQKKKEKEKFEPAFFFLKKKKFPKHFFVPDLYVLQISGHSFSFKINFKTWYSGQKYNLTTLPLLRWLVKVG